MADVALGRAKGDSVAGRLVEDSAEAFHLDHIADLGAGAVGFHQGRRGRVNARRFPGAAGGELLADGVGGGDTLALAIA